MVDLEQEHVHKVYSEIAAHFSSTRYKPWPRIAQFLQRQPPGSIIADVGCGNGKYLGVNAQIFMMGSDICPELVSIGHGRGHEVLTCDCLHLPYRKSQFDGVICIAVIHHLSSESRRLKALVEISRVLRPGGEALIYVWAMEQERKKFSSQDVMVPWHLQPKYTSGGSIKTPAEGKDPGVLAEERAARMRAKKQEKKRKKRMLKEAQCETTESRGSLGSREGLPVVGERVCGTEAAEVEGLQDNFGGLVVDSEAPRENSGPKMSVQGSSSLLMEMDPEGESRSSKRAEMGSSRMGIEPSRLEQSLEPSRLEKLEPKPASRLEKLEPKPASRLEKLEPKPALERSPDRSCDTCEPKAKPSELGYTTYQRYYHVFREGELVDLVQRVGELRVQEEFYDHENWCVLASKN